MNAPGEIRRLTEIADPDVGLITNVGPAHLEGLGSLEGVARAKGELFATHAAAGDRDRERRGPARGGARRGVPGRVVRVRRRAPTIAAEDVRTDARGAAAFRLRVGDDAIDVRLPDSRPAQRA